jgi:hypothetical protein
MKMYYQAVWGLLSLFWLVSCAVVPASSPFSPVYVTDRAKYVLLPPADIEAPLDMLQQITGSYGKESFLMNAWVSANEQGIDMSLLTGFGTSLGEFSLREGAISFSSAVFPPALKPEYVAADFQFCFYRVDALIRGLKKTSLNMVVEQRLGAEGCVEVRTIYDKKKVIIEIEKSPTRILYTNHLRGYAYTLEGDF